MATQTSSLIGVSLTAADATGQFAVGTRAAGGGALGGGAEWEYVYATATISTGKLVYIASAGTAVILTTGNVVASTAGAKIGVAQFLMSAGEYGFVATYGGPLYIACSGVLPPTTAIGFADTAGLLTTTLVAGSTAGGVFVTVSGSSLLLAQGLITYPRCVAASAVPLG